MYKKITKIFQYKTIHGKNKQISQKAVIDVMPLINRYKTFLFLYKFHHTDSSVPLSDYTLILTVKTKHSQERKSFVVVRILCYKISSFFYLVFTVKYLYFKID